MAGFMNAELIAIRESLTCAHCKSTFQGSDAQARAVKYEQRRVFCSSICRTADARVRLCTPVPNRGPCKTCGETFFSRREAMFCGMKCYTGSRQFRAMIAGNLKRVDPEKRSMAQREGHEEPCLECEAPIWRKPSDVKHGRKKFCSKPCYRSWMAKRFDRWIANPQQISLPQAYDEFLDQMELRCLLPNCGWRGKHLSLHVNQAHGVPAAEFKRASGFNLKSGIIAKPLAEAYAARSNVGVAVPGACPPPPRPVKGQVNAYQSLEGREHRAKATALLSSIPGPTRACQGCGEAFTQKVVAGRKLFCTTTCRDDTYARAKAAKAKKRTQGPDGKFRWS